MSAARSHHLGRTTGLAIGLAALVSLHAITIPRAIVSAAIALISLFWLAVIQPWLILWAIAGAVLSTLPSVLIRRGTQQIYDAVTDLEAKINESYFDARRSFDLIRMEQLQTYHTARIRSQDDRHFALGIRSEAFGATETVLANIVSAVTIFGSWIVVLVLLSHGHIHIDNLCLAEGGHLHLEGANGAGKSLLLRGLAGLEHTTGTMTSSRSATRPLSLAISVHERSP